MTAPEPNPPRHPESRFLLWYLRFSAVLLMAMVIAIVLLVFQNRANIAAQQRSNIQQCKLANIARLQDIAIWNTLIQHPASPAAAARNKSDHLARLVAAKDAPRDCAAAFSGN